MEQIKRILEANDIAGSIILHENGYGEHYIKVDPSYSGAKFKHLPGGGTTLQIRIKTEEVGKKRAKELAEGTTNMFGILTPLLEEHLKIAMYGDMICNEHYNPESSGSGHSSHEEQNN